MKKHPVRTIRHPQLQVEQPRPLPPVEPALEDCCRSGCSPCIFDTYEEALERYNMRLKAWQDRNPGQ